MFIFLTVTCSKIIRQEGIVAFHCKIVRRTLHAVMYTVCVISVCVCVCVGGWFRCPFCFENRWISWRSGWSHFWNNMLYSDAVTFPILMKFIAEWQLRVTALTEKQTGYWAYRPQSTPPETYVHCNGLKKWSCRSGLSREQIELLCRRALRRNQPFPVRFVKTETQAANQGDYVATRSFPNFSSKCL
jgi:hypothetical protein